MGKLAYNKRMVSPESWLGRLRHPTCGRYVPLKNQHQMKILIEKEVALHHYEVRADKSQVLKLLHPEFKEVGESGVSFSLNSILELLGNEQPNGSKIHSQDYESIKLTSDVYLLLYRSANIDVNGIPTHFAKRSSIWSLTDEGWQMKYHQGTPCKPFSITR